MTCNTALMRVARVRISMYLPMEPPFLTISTAATTISDIATRTSISSIYIIRKTTLPSRPSSRQTYTTGSGVPITRLRHTTIPFGRTAVENSRGKYAVLVRRSTSISTKSSRAIRNSLSMSSAHTITIPSQNTTSSGLTKTSNSSTIT